MIRLLQIINKIRGSDLRHRRFKLLTSELDSKFNDVLYFNSIRWLSCGQVLSRFYDLFTKIEQFLKEQNLYSEFKVISTSNWKQQLYFLCDITKHLNDLNLKLQGRDKFVWDLAKDVNEFQLKLVAFKNQIGEIDFTFFPVLDANKQNHKYTDESFVKFLNKLIEQFESRFSDFTQLNVVFMFLKNPFAVDKKNIDNLSSLLHVKKSHLDFDISLIDSETQMPNEKCDIMWNRLLRDNSFFVLNIVVPKFLCMFGSTYVCECTFSSLTRRKSRYRSNLLQDSLECEIRCELCKDVLDFRKMVKGKQCHPSH